MPQMILNKLVNQAEQISQEEKAGFRSQRNTTKMILNFRLLVEKTLEHQKELFHDFVVFNSIGYGMMAPGEP